MKMKDIAGMSAQEVSKKVAAIRQEIFELKMKNSIGQVANPIQIRFLRRDLARLMTAANSKKS